MIPDHVTDRSRSRVQQGHRGQANQKANEEGGPLRNVQEEDPVTRFASGTMRTRGYAVVKRFEELSTGTWAKPRKKNKK